MLELELKNTKSIVELKDKENSLMSKDVSLKKRRKKKNIL